MKIGKYLKNFFHNIKYLLKYDLFEHENEILYNALDRVEDIYRFEICDPQNIPPQIPKVLDSYETIDLLLKEPKSFCRFGDGEINIINGMDLAFQKYDKELAETMRYILENEVPDLYVGIMHGYFHSSKALNPYNRSFYLINVKPLRDWLLNHCYKRRTYIAAGFNQMYISTADLNLQPYYNKVKILFQNRKMVIFIGEGIQSRLEHSIFTYAESVEYETGPVRDAFSQKDNLIARATQYGTDYTFGFILGPASKVLVYELTKLGYMAWDLGHLAQDYDAFMRGVEKSPENISDFYAADG